MSLGHATRQYVQRFRVLLSNVIGVFLFFYNCIKRVLLNLIVNAHTFPLTKFKQISSVIKPHGFITHYWILFPQFSVICVRFTRLNAASREYFGNVSFNFLINLKRNKTKYEKNMC